MTTLHFMHIGKTGGTAVKSALRTARLAYWNEKKAHRFPETPYGRIRLHHHRFRLHQLPPDDYVLFFVRDPIARFLSGFHSRQSKGQPRYCFEWTPAERRAFEAFPTPQRLASSLVSDDADERLRAQDAMRAIRHLRFQTRWIGSPRQLRERLHQVAYIGRQETLDDDWRQIKALLALPEDLELPSDPVGANRRHEDVDSSLDEIALKALRDWYADDYRLVAYCDRVRERRGWATRPQGGTQAIRSRLRAAAPWRR